MESVKRRIRRRQGNFCCALQILSHIMVFESLPPAFNTNMPSDGGGGPGKGSNKGPTPPKTQSADEFWHAHRRCAKCTNFYTEVENQNPALFCTYHPGTYKEVSRKELACGWTCCRSNALESLNRDAIGCKRYARHTEDVAFTELIKLFPYDPNASFQEQLQHVSYPRIETKKEETNTKPTAQNEFITHRVSSTDTLAGLALKYKTTRQEIKRANRMTNDLVLQHDFLYIPKSEGITAPISDDQKEETRIAMITKSFIKKTRCSRQEANFYLEEGNWNLDTAIDKWNADAVWANSQPK